MRTTDYKENWAEPQISQITQIVFYGKYQLSTIFPHKGTKYYKGNKKRI